VVLAAIGLALLAHLKEPDEPVFPAIILGSVTSLGLAIIHFYYTGKNVISFVYAADGIVELIFFLGWMIIFSRIRKTVTR
jgi:hypothetical protein